MAVFLPPPFEKGCDISMKTKEFQEQIAAGIQDQGGAEGLLQAIENILEVVVASNFTGELTTADKSTREGIYDLSAKSSDCNKEIRAALTVDGEVVNQNIKHPILLLILLQLIEAKVDKYYGTASIHLWRTRVYFVYQRMLANRSHKLLTRIMESYDAMQALPDDTEGIPSKSEIHLTRGMAHYYYHEPHHSNDHIKKAFELSGLRAKLTSMMGVRTEHQSYETAQLVVRAAGSAKPEDIVEQKYQPVVCTAESANVLDRPRKLQDNIDAGHVTEQQVKEEAENYPHKDECPQDDDTEVVDSPLTAYERAIILGLCVNVRNNNPMHGLTEAERLPYLERLFVEKGVSWTMRSQILLLRSRMEQKRVRVRERALLQLCQLCDQYNLTVEGEESTVHRLQDFWLVLYPSEFGLKSELAKVYYDIGMVKSALDIHESLENWSDVVKCCRKLERSAKAESLLKDLLKDDPENPILLSSLGDATRNEDYYKQAWSLSNGRLAAPARGLGELYLEKERYEEACEYFEKALQLNPVYGADWFSMGWAAIKTKQWAKAANCYTRNVQINMEDGHSWSNLAMCNLHLGKQVPAFHCLKLAKKWSPASWKIWDNLVTVAIDIGEKRVAINTLHQIVQQKGRSYKVRSELLIKLVQRVLAVRRGEEEEELKPESLTKDQQEELDDEVFDIVPFGADIGLDYGDIEVEKNVTTQEHIENARSASVRSLCQDMHNLLAKITSHTTTESQLYKAYGDFLIGMDNPLEAFDQRLKQLRCVLKRDWQVDKTNALMVIQQATEVAECAALVTDEVLSARKVQTTPPKMQATMQVQPVLKLAEDVFGKSEEYIALKKAVEALS
eukprot:TRINITY_DN30677_c0_g1_i1.p1 TRINITY_DN30677_c0_g1~~TRINITY_DN30677_c0_g1_i1.p1  ORF type:complete len:845 (+),score=182.25 TRINITY_DN30677_c0_g1_i1:39-2573(+)